MLLCQNFHWDIFFWWFLVLGLGFFPFLAINQSRANFESIKSITKSVILWLLYFLRAAAFSVAVMSLSCWTKAAMAAAQYSLNTYTPCCPGLTSWIAGYRDPDTCKVRQCQATEWMREWMTDWVSEWMKCVWEGPKAIFCLPACLSFRQPFDCFPCIYSSYSESFPTKYTTRTKVLHNSAESNYISTCLLLIFLGGQRRRGILEAFLLIYMHSVRRIQIVEALHYRFIYGRGQKMSFCEDWIPHISFGMCCMQHVDTAGSGPEPKPASFRFRWRAKQVWQLWATDRYTDTWTKVSWNSLSATPEFIATRFLEGEEEDSPVKSLSQSLSIPSSDFSFSIKASSADVQKCISIPFCQELWIQMHKSNAFVRIK